MKYLVRMDVSIPHDMPAHQRAETLRREKEYSQELQRDGRWVSIWRVVGQYANYSVFDVESHDELHGLLQGLPLFPFMDLEVTALATHPSDVAASVDVAT